MTSRAKAQPWGAVQPIAGAIANRYGPGRVLAAGVLIFALGSALTPFVTSGFGLMVTIGVLSAAGAAFERPAVAAQ